MQDCIYCPIFRGLPFTASRSIYKPFNRTLFSYHHNSNMIETISERPSLIRRLSKAHRTAPPRWEIYCSLTKLPVAALRHLVIDHSLFCDKMSALQQMHYFIRQLLFIGPELRTETFSRQTTKCHHLNAHAVVSEQSSTITFRRLDRNTLPWFHNHSASEKPLIIELST